MACNAPERSVDDGSSAPKDLKYEHWLPHALKAGTLPPLPGVPNLSRVEREVRASIDPGNYAALHPLLAALSSDGLCLSTGSERPYIVAKTAQCHQLLILERNPRVYWYHRLNLALLSLSRISDSCRGQRANAGTRYDYHNLRFLTHMDNPHARDWKSGVYSTLSEYRKGKEARAELESLQNQALAFWQWATSRQNHPLLFPNLDEYYLQLHSPGAAKGNLPDGPLDARGYFASPSALRFFQAMARADLPRAKVFCVDDIVDEIDWPTSESQRLDRLLPLALLDFSHSLSPPDASGSLPVEEMRKRFVTRIEQAWTFSVKLAQAVSLAPSAAILVAVPLPLGSAPEGATAFAHAMLALDSLPPPGDRAAMPEDSSASRQFLCFRDFLLDAYGWLPATLADVQAEYAQKRVRSYRCAR